HDGHRRPTGVRRAPRPRPARSLGRRLGRRALRQPGHAAFDHGPRATPRAGLRRGRDLAGPDGRAGPPRAGPAAAATHPSPELPPDRAQPRKDTIMSDHDEQPSRRRVLQAGLFALAATQMPDGLIARAQAQGVKPSANLIGKLEGAEVVTDIARYPK